MDIPLNAKVRCVDGECGRSTYVIVNPVSRQVTHVVVKEDGLSGREHLVPLDWVTEATPNLIRLRYDKEELDTAEPFLEVEYLREALPDYDALTEDYLVHPYRVPQSVRMVGVKHHRIPPGELAVRRGARVEATDGPAGRVDEFLVDPEDSQITHLILREGHLWGQKDVTIPVSEIERVDGDRVYLKLDKHSIAALPSIPVREGWL